MLNSELALFRCFAERASRYLEFGAGGSTVVATQLVRAAVTTLDSSVEWLEKVRQACAAGDSEKLSTVHVNIGPVGEWGAPIGESHKSKWPTYHADIWSREGVLPVDMILVDGRFRVSCVLQSFRHAAADTAILVHDFGSRTHYQAVHEFGHEIARAEQLSAFIRKPNFSDFRCLEVLKQYMFDPR